MRSNNVASDTPSRWASASSSAFRPDERHHLNIEVFIYCSLVQADRAKDLFRLRIRSFQVGDQSVKGLLIRVMTLPVAEVGNEIFSNLAGGIFSGVGVEAPPVAQGFERR